MTCFRETRGFLGSSCENGLSYYTEGRYRHPGENADTIVKSGLVQWAPVGQGCWIIRVSKAKSSCTSNI